MSDDRYGQAPPDGPPPQQGGMAPPPPPPPPGLFPDAQPPAAYAPPPSQPAYGQQPAQPAAPKKRKTGLIIGLVVGLLLLCGLGSCVALVAIGASGAAEQKKILEQADAHYSAAMSAVETAGATLEKSGTDDTAKVNAAIEDANKAMRTGRDEIAASRASAERLEDSEGKTAYLASLTAATEALDALEDLVAYVGTAAGMGGKVQEAGKASSKAADDLNAAIDAGNANDYGTMKSKAQAAASGYVQAAKLFREAAALDKSAGLDKAAAFADKQKEQADLAVKMADEGKAGKTSAYNADIKRVEELRKQAAAIGDPEIVKDPQWVEKRLADLTKRTTEAGAKADQLHEQALKALAGG